MAAPDPELVDKMHRYFAVECNNRAWELAEQETRTGEEDEELMHAAHTAAWHWAKVGSPINDARARQLLAEVYAQAGEGNRAVALAKACRDFFAGGEGTEWDRAFSTLELAYATAVAGDRAAAEQLLQKASQQGERIAEKGERDFFVESHQRLARKIAGL